MTRSIHLASTGTAIFPTNDRMTFANYWDHFVARMGIRRGDHRVLPGLYKIGSPTGESPVLVTANYSLSFDALRTQLTGMDAYILVLDTHGVNVWCAAGKHTFGTRELVNRIKTVNLMKVVDHRRLILPQLGAPGVAAHEVKKQTGFVVEYGPVRASDLPEYLKSHHAAPEMREVQFPLHSRLVLIPVEVMSILLPALIAIGLGFIIGNLPYALAVLAAVLGGVVLFPALLPWLPSHDFSTKGGFLGFLLAIPFVLFAFLGNPLSSGLREVGQALGYLLMISSAVAYMALNFTGSTPFTSRTGVRKEIFSYIRPIAIAFAAGVILLIVFAFVH